MISEIWCQADPRLQKSGVRDASNLVSGWHANILSNILFIYTKDKIFKKSNRRFHPQSIVASLPKTEASLLKVYLWDCLLMNICAPCI
jgi:hypothetical protein